MSKLTNPTTTELPKGKPLNANKFIKDIKELKKSIESDSPTWKKEFIKTLCNDHDPDNIRLLRGIFVEDIFRFISEQVVKKIIDEIHDEATQACIDCNGSGLWRGVRTCFTCNGVGARHYSPFKKFLKDKYL